MRPEEFFREVRTLFDYLLDEYGFRVVSEEVADEADACHMTIESPDCQMRIGKERGDIFVYLRPRLKASDVEFTFGQLAKAAGEESDSPHGVTSPPVNWDLEQRARIDRQLRWYSERLLSLYAWIRLLFTESSHASELERLAEVRRMEAEQLRRLLERFTGKDHPDSDVGNQNV